MLTPVDKLDEQTEEAFSTRGLAEKTIGKTATGVADFVPVVGDVLAAGDVVDSARQGDVLGTVVNTAALGIGLVPIVGDLAARGLKTALKQYRKTSNVSNEVIDTPIKDTAELIDPVETLSLKNANDTFLNNQKRIDEGEILPEFEIDSNIIQKKQKLDPEKTSDVIMWEEQSKINQQTFRKDTGVDVVSRTKELEQAALKYYDIVEKGGDPAKARVEYLKVLEKIKPIREWDDVPLLTTPKQQVLALKSNQQKNGNFIDIPKKAAKTIEKMLGHPINVIKLMKDQLIEGRLDISAYKDFNAWITTLTGKGIKGQIYGDAIHFVSPKGGKVIFKAREETARNILTRQAKREGKPNPKTGLVEYHEKTPFGVISGAYNPMSPKEIRQKVKKLLKDPEWTQVGFDPRRLTSFYTRSNRDKFAVGSLVESADEAFQIGPLVLAKNVKLLDQAAQPRLKDGGLVQTFNKGGVIPMNTDKQMNMAFMQEGGLRDDGATQDPVSGNEVPSGSMDQEVRDDVPAMLSEGEYVIPADVVRYFGVKFFEDLRIEAKTGMQRMEQDGRIGGEPMGEAPMGAPEEEALPFDSSELVMVEEKAEGGIVGFSNGGDNSPTFTYTPNTKYGTSGTGGTGFEMIPYTHTSDGRTVVMAFYNGQPMQPIPEGFVPEADYKANQQAGQTATTDAAPVDKNVSGGLSPYTTTEDKNIGQPETADEFFAAGDSNLSPLSKFVGLSPIVGALSDMSHARGVDRARELLESGDITEYDRLALSYYANSNPKEQGSFFNFFGLGEDSDPEYPEGFEFLTFGDGKKLTYTDSAGKTHTDTIQNLKEKFAPFAKKQIVDVLPSQARGANEIEQNNQKTLFESTGHALTNYGNIKFMADNTGLKSMDLFRIDDGSGQDVKFIRRYEMEKALGKKNLTSDDILKFDPASFETVDAEDSALDKIFKVDRTEVKPTANVIQKTKPTTIAPLGSPPKTSLSKEEFAAKEKRKEKATVGYKGGRATGGLVKRRSTKKS